MSLSLRDIEHFLNVAATGSLEQAAARSALPQRKLTAAIERLEKEFGLQLFEQNARKKHLTTAGARFIGSARDLHLKYGDAVRVTSEIQYEKGGLLRIGFADATRANAVAGALSGLLRDHPKLRVKLRVGESDRLMIQAVRNGQLDIAVLSTNTPEVEGCHCTVFGTDYCRPVVRSGHPLALRAQVELADLQSHDWIFANPLSGLWQSLNAVFVKHGLASPKVAVETEEFSDFQLALARFTDLITMAPLASLRAMGTDGLHVLDLPALHLPRVGMALTRANAIESGLLVTFRDTLAKASAIAAAIAGE